MYTGIVVLDNVITAIVIHMKNDTTVSKIQFRCGDL